MDRGILDAAKASNLDCQQVCDLFSNKASALPNKFRTSRGVGLTSMPCVVTWSLGGSIAVQSKPGQGSMFRIQPPFVSPWNHTYAPLH